jgi:hypothetical protein
MKSPGGSGLAVWEDDGGSFAVHSDGAGAFRPAVAVKQMVIAAPFGLRMQLGRLITRLVITSVPERRCTRFRLKRRLSMVFVMYGMVMLAVFAAISLAAVRDARLAPVPVRAAPVAK